MGKPKRCRPQSQRVLSELPSSIELSKVEAQYLTIGIQRLQSRVHAVIALLNLVECRVVDRLVLKRRSVFYHRDAADEELVGRASEHGISCHARERLVMHVLLHAHGDLLLTVSAELESTRLGDAVNLFDGAEQDALEVPQTPEGGGVHRKLLV